MPYARPIDSEQGALDGFLQKYPADERAQDFLLSSPDDVVERVIRDFRPPKEGESDYSGLLTSFVKRVRGWQAEKGGGHGHHGGDARGRSPPQRTHDAFDLRKVVEKFCRRYPIDDDAYGCLSKCPTEVAMRVMREFRPKYEGEADYSALLKTFVRRVHSDGAGSGTYSSGRDRSRDRRSDRHSYRGGGRHSPTDDFFRRYPIDDRAREYFDALPTELREQVIAQFRPKRENEADYSGLMTSFITRCRQDWRGEEKLAPRGTSRRAQEEDDPTDMEGFRRKYPMDERAWDFLSTSSAEVIAHVLSTFNPRRQNDPDYSAPVTAYVRECRRNSEGGGEIGGRRRSPSRGRVRRSRSRSRRGGRRGRELERSLSPRKPRAAARADDDPLQEAINRFLDRYPCDDRAFTYLLQSSNDVVERVLAEFKPKHENEPDYSALVTTFTKRCRESSAGPPPVALNARGALR